MYFVPFSCSLHCLLRSFGVGVRTDHNGEIGTGGEREGKGKCSTALALTRTFEMTSQYGVQSTGRGKRKDRGKEKKKVPKRGTTYKGNKKRKQVFHMQKTAKNAKFQPLSPAVCHGLLAFLFVVFLRNHTAGPDNSQ